jgi:hypothetical protein
MKPVIGLTSYRQRGQTGVWDTEMAGTRKPASKVISPAKTSGLGAFAISWTENYCTTKSTPESEPQSFCLSVVFGDRAGWLIFTRLRSTLYLVHNYLVKYLI